MDRSGVAIVLLPAVDDKVMKVSSEKVPHMTLLHLPPADQIPNLEEIVLYIQHAAKELSPVWMTVDYRGELGEDNADVLFFKKGRYESGRIEDFRHHLLLNDGLKMAYDSIYQFEEFTPHLTLGYPDTPANEVDEKIWSVDFDRLAVWTGEYDGPEFRLEYADTMAESAVYMSDISTVDRGALAVSQMLGIDAGGHIEHYGVKGMRWGVRKADKAQGKIDKAAAKGDAKTVNKQTAKRDKALEKADSKWEKSVYTMKGAVDVHNSMAAYCNGRIGALNDKYPDANLNEEPYSPTTQSYFDEVMALQSAGYSHAVKAVHGSSPSGKKEAVYINDDKGERIEIRNKEIKHGDDFEETDLIVLVKVEDGKIVEFNEAELGAEHSDAAENFLAHYGVKGMRWGIRKDRSASRGGASQGPTAVVVSQKKPGKFAKAEGGQGFPAHPDALNAQVTRRVAKKSTTDALSNAELKTAIERMQLEQRFNQLEFASDRRSRGARFLQGFMGRKKPTKFRDMDEEIGQETRDAVKKAIAYQMAKKAAKTAAAAA